MHEFLIGAGILGAGIVALLFIICICMTPILFFASLAGVILFTPLFIGNAVAYDITPDWIFIGFMASIGGLVLSSATMEEWL